MCSNAHSCFMLECLCVHVFVRECRNSAGFGGTNPHSGNHVAGTCANVTHLGALLFTLLSSCPSLLLTFFITVDECVHRTVFGVRTRRVPHCPRVCLCAHVCVCACVCVCVCTYVRVCEHSWISWSSATCCSPPRAFKVYSSELSRYAVYCALCVCVYMCVCGYMYICAFLCVYMFVCVCA